MKKEIVINASKDRSRIAIVEDGQLVELYVENPDNVRTIGNVYLGNVKTITSNAAFIDVGQKKDCYLAFSDITDNFPQLQALAGEDVPGLDEPVLSLAPAKRVSDDDDEPEVEDSLEVASGDDGDGDEKKGSGGRSRGRRRSRGRGRGRGRGRRSEEEEQEEDRLDGALEEEEQEETRRPLPAVLDLTSSPKRRPTRSPKADEPKADDTNGEADEAPAETPSRSRRAKKEAPAETPAPEETPSDASEDEAPRSRRRSKKAKDEAPAEAPAEDETPADDAEAQAEDTDEQDETDESGGRKRSRRRRRGRRGRGRTRRSSGGDDAPDAEASTDDRSTTPKGEGADAPAKGAVSPTGRSRRPAQSDIEEAAEARADDAPDEAPEKAAPSRSRRGKRASEPAADAEAAADDGPSGRKPLPRTLDLTGAAKPAPSKPTADDEPTESRSRRRTRSSDTPQAESKADAEAGAKADAKEDGRSRRRGRRSGSDAQAEDTSSKDASSKTEAKADDRSSRDAKKDDARSRGRRSDDAAKGGGGRGRSKSSGKSSGKSSEKVPSNEEILKRSKRIIVKITKEAISNKGPRVSTDLSLAGRFLVLVPAADYVAVSKKIESAKERRRLRTLASSLKPDRFGVIVRTVAEGRDAKSLDQDLRLLVEKWRKIEAKLNEQPKPPVLLYQDVNMVSSIIRDLFSDDYDRILVDDPKVFKNVQAYVKAVAPSMADKVEQHRGRAPVFRSMGIEKQVEEAFSKRVNMRGGGYLFIETTEAMHVVDVNSGRAGRGKSHKQNLIDVNVEAAKEVAKQLRLRDLGGIIVVDFIDLRYDRDRKKVTDALKEAFKKDRAVTKLLPMSDFGLVQITRQRLRPSITANATDDDGEPLDPAEAAAAAGAGEIRRRTAPEPEPADEPDDRPADRSASRDDRPALSPEEATPSALAGRLRGWLEHYRATVDDRYRGRPIVVKVHPLFGSYLRRGFPSPLTRWRLKLRGITFVMEEDAAVDPLAFEVRDQKSGRSLLKKYAQ